MYRPLYPGRVFQSGARMVYLRLEVVAMFTLSPTAFVRCSYNLFVRDKIVLCRIMQAYFTKTYILNFIHIFTNTCFSFNVRIHYISIHNILDVGVFISSFMFIFTNTGFCFYLRVYKHLFVFIYIYKLAILF